MLLSSDVLFPKQIISNLWVSCNMFCFFLKKKIATYFRRQEQFSDKNNQSRSVIHLFLNNMH